MDLVILLSESLDPSELDRDPSGCLLAVHQGGQEVSQVKKLVCKVRKEAAAMYCIILISGDQLTGHPLVLEREVLHTRNKECQDDE
jgi:hypothetical protein